MFMGVRAMSFGAPVLLLLLIALLPVAAALLWLARWRRAATRRLVRGAGQRVSRTRRLLKAALLLAALALLAVAAARPQHGSKRILLPREGTDVMVTLDVSASMLATDIAPSRFDRAKVVLSALLDRLQGDRVGLTVFAGSAELRFPLTTDVAAARQLINSTAIKEGGLSAGTGIGNGIRLAVDSFPADDQTRGKVLVLVSDGEDLSGSPQDAIKGAVARGITVHTIGVGTAAGGPIVAPARPNGTAVPRVDPETGRPATSRLDEGLRRDLATAGKGRYVDGSSDDAAATIADEISRLERTRFESQEGRVPIERFQIFAAVALALLALELLISEGGRARTAARSGQTRERKRRGERAA
jgi:Ca-activated chloride channel family protein